MSADAKLKAYIDRILRCREVEDEAKQDTKDVYAELAADGYEKAIVGQVVTFLRKREKDGDKVAEQSAKFDLYLEAYERPSHAHTREERSDNGLNIQTKHTDIRSGGLAAASAGLTTRPAEESVVPHSPETAAVPSSEQSEGNGSRDHQHVHSRQTDEAKHGGQDGEPAGADHAIHSDQPLAGGDHEVASNAERVPTSNTGEGAAKTALPAKPKFVLRPYCRNPGEGCGGSGTTHCHSCLKAREEVAA